MEEKGPHCQVMKMVKYMNYVHQAPRLVHAYMLASCKENKHVALALLQHQIKRQLRLALQLIAIILANVKFKQSWPTIAVKISIVTTLPAVVFLTVTIGHRIKPAVISSWQHT